ncbi:major facilitator superfamily protein [Hirsutella rhossiliensis]|uniref:Sugar transporter domain-containing protein n=1 Tax=Hirsutella rhossiliensis TaxID=111463 RepID=A0A9P8SDX5_9HYPO|nr:sugar transporter domain-containing protein [Hirsutella rhossiliensis]KAH0959071.1 sugar transporter domain-containing protein [Hirsutella rhossiliensis]
MADGGKHVALQHRGDRAVAGPDGPTATTKAGAEPRADADADPVEPIHTEHQLSFLEAVRLYPKAIAWSAFFSIGVISAAFDQQLVGSLYSAPQFQRDFGYKYRGEYIIDASWQSGLSMGPPVGQVVGALFAAYPMEWFGRKRTFAACVVGTAGLVCIQFFARAIGVLVVGELLAGLVLGVFVVIAPTYGSEVCPTAIRGHLTSYIELCFVLGQLVANGVTVGTQHMRTHWAYSLPFALQWFWAAIIIPGLFFAPESPWWLVRRARLDDAQESLRRLASPDVDVAATLAFIVETNRLELELEAGSTYRDCFRRVNLRRTEISSGVYCAQVLSGIYLISYGTYFFQQAGLPTDQAFNMSVAFLGIGFLGVLVSWFLLVCVGRRALYVGGLAVLSGLQLLIGILDCVPGRPSGVIWAESALMLVWNLLYNMTIGPVCFVLLSECSATRVRSKTIAVATAAQGLLGIVMTIAIPYMINSAQANMQGKLGFFFGGLAGLCLLWAYFRVPETRGRTYEELDLLFDKGVPARRFKRYQLDNILGVRATDSR